MRSVTAEVYSAREIALAGGVPEERVATVMPSPLVRRDEAVAIAKLVADQLRASPTPPPAPLFSSAAADRTGFAATWLVWSATLHAMLAALALVIAVFGLSARAASPAQTASTPLESIHLVFLQLPGPGGGGGGGGNRQPTPASAALLAGHRALQSPLPARPTPPEPLPKRLDSEPLPTLIAPVLAASHDPVDRPGIVEKTEVVSDSRGQGRDGGTGTGGGAGAGSGTGSGIGPGMGGGIGGGPYRPGSGIDPPRLLREVKADYTEEARQRGISGEVLLEIVVRRDGLVGETRVVKGLGYGLNERAVEAVRQWRFSPAVRQGSAVDVIVEVSVEFKVR